jgi:AcrR family transcriptional regulator
LIDKKSLIIESAIKLFARKGFSSTSIQEIASESGISKGAFYTYFKSKEELLVSILQFYFNEFQKHISILDHENLPARDKFAEQLNAMLKVFIQNKEFIIMQAREEAIPKNDEVRKILVQIHTNLQNFYQQSLLSIYGQGIQNVLMDLTIILDGIFQSFSKILFFDSSAFKPEELASYILRRMDNIVNGLINEQPIITTEILARFERKTADLFNLSKPNIEDALAEIRIAIYELENKEDLEISLEVLENEIRKKTPRIPVIQGMLSNFKQISSLDITRKRILQYFNIKSE